MVALIAGGVMISGKLNEYFEVYSPDGRCPQPINRQWLDNMIPALGYINGKITYCTRYSLYPYNSGCSSYNVTADTWTLFTKMTYRHSGSPSELLLRPFI